MWKKYAYQVVSDFKDLVMNLWVSRRSSVYIRRLNKPSNKINDNFTKNDFSYSMKSYENSENKVIKSIDIYYVLSLTE